MKRAVVFLLASLASVAFASTTMSIAMQDGAPVQLQSTTHGLSDALEAAVFKNRSGKPITAYRIGWVSLVEGKAKISRGVWMNTPGKIDSGADQIVPAQGIPINLAAQQMVFFVSDVTFADGTHWSASKSDVIKSSRHP
jgi:hypothetical protein